MNRFKTSVSQDTAKAWILLGIPVISIVGSIMHFVYEWSGNSVIAGIFAPVNESVWEHLKLAFWPALIWWVVGFLFLKKYNKVIADQWFISCAVAELVYPLVIVSFFYTYTGALGVESMILDIFSFFLAIALGQILALHVYKYAKPRHSHRYIALLVILLLAIIFIVFTFTPPHIPLFEDPLTGNYGI